MEFFQVCLHPPSETIVMTTNCFRTSYKNLNELPHQTDNQATVIGTLAGSSVKRPLFPRWKNVSDGGMHCKECVRGSKHQSAMAQAVDMSTDISYDEYLKA